MKANYNKKIDNSNLSNASANNHKKINGFDGARKIIQIFSIIFTGLIAIIGVLERMFPLKTEDIMTFRIYFTFLCTAFSFVYLFCSLRVFALEFNAYLKNKGNTKHDQIMMKSFEYVKQVVTNIYPICFIQLLYMLNVAPNIKGMNIVNILSIIFFIISTVLQIFADSSKDSIIYRFFSIVLNIMFCVLFAVIFSSMFKNPLYSYSFILMVIIFGYVYKKNAKE